MAIVFVTVAPLGTGSTSLSRYVAGGERVLRDSPRILGGKVRSVQQKLA